MKNLNDMMCLDLYLSAIDSKKYEIPAPQIKTTDTRPMPLLSWDIYSEFMAKEDKSLARESDIRMVKQLSSKLKWKNDIDALFENEHFEALIITDINKKIVWVNDGFSAMTGYPKNFALNKNPSFLQGEQTSETAKKSIRKKLRENSPFKEIIVNYRKDAPPMPAN